MGYPKSETFFCTYFWVHKSLSMMRTVTSEQEFIVTSIYMQERTKKKFCESFVRRNLLFHVEAGKVFTVMVICLKRDPPKKIIYWILKNSWQGKVGSFLLLFIRALNVIHSGLNPEQKVEKVENVQNVQNVQKVKKFQNIFHKKFEQFQRYKKSKIKL
jgi:hypothetical protein